MQYYKNLTHNILIQSGNKEYVRLSGMIYDSLVNGEGMRRVLFSQGCNHKCPGCFNTDTHDFNKGRLFNTETIIKEIISDPLLDGVTFSGGDPFQQAHAFAYIAKELKFHNINIWAYTGYTFEKLVTKSTVDKDIYEMLHNIDVIVDGRFIQTLFDPSLKYRGSSNQRIIDVKKSLEYNHVVLYI